MLLAKFTLLVFFKKKNLLKLNEFNVNMYLCASVSVCVRACVCVHSSCLFSVQQNLINSAGMEIIAAASAQETERDGEEAAWGCGGGWSGGWQRALWLLYFPLQKIIQLKIIVITMIKSCFG